MSDSDQNPVSGVVATVDDLGKKIRMKRKHLGLTLEHVAGLTGIGYRYLSELERGKKTIEMGKALKIMNCLGLELIVLPKGFWEKRGPDV